MKISVWKRRLLVAAPIVICLSILSYGTLAYFTAEDTAENVITAGSVDIELLEMTDDGEPFPTDGITGVMPGDSVSKIVTVKNTGNNPAYVRIALDMSVLTPESEELATDVISLDINTEAWTEKGGYYYCNEILEAGAESAPLFTSVTFAREEMDNSYMDAVVHIDADAQAVQSQNNGANVWEAIGWPSAE